MIGLQKFPLRLRARLFILPITVLAGFAVTA
jgi:hypothetical protein